MLTVLIQLMLIMVMNSDDDDDDMSTLYSISVVIFAFCVVCKAINDLETKSEKKKWQRRLVFAETQSVLHIYEL